MFMRYDLGSGISVASQQTGIYHGPDESHSSPSLIMGIRLPPLNALRAFECAARHLSFKRAAAELNVSPAAISHQIRLLESYIGASLFLRQPGALSLTDQGRAALPRLQEGFRALADGANAMRGSKHDRAASLSVRAGPALAAKWLMPRLRGFLGQNPHVEIHLDASMRAVDSRAPPAEPSRPDNTEPDLDIRFGAGLHPGHRVDRLFAVALLPVCRPDYLARDPSLRSPVELAHYTLLHDDAVAALPGNPGWAAWLGRAGVTSVDSTRGQHFSHGALAVDAAVSGMGVALAMDVVAADDLQAQRLAQPFDIELPLAPAYYLVSSESRADEPHVTALRTWLLREANHQG
jgi:LysR family glycine cleavage system transcriptional activator